MTTKRLGPLAYAFLSLVVPATESRAEGARVPSSRASQAVAITIQGRIEVAVVDDFRHRKATERVEIVTARGERFILESGGVLVGTLTSGSTVRLTAQRQGNRLTVASAHTLRPGPSPQDMKRLMSTDIRKVLVILSHWPGGTAFSASAATTTMSHVTSFFNSESYTYVSMTADVVAPAAALPTPITNCDNGTALSNAAAAAYNVDHAYAIANYTNVMYVFDSQCALPGNEGEAVGYVGGSTSIYRGGQFDDYTAAHELGHNFGLNHSTTLSCGSDQLGLTCTLGPEYGDEHDLMSSSFTHLNAANKAALSWFPSGALTTVQSGRARVVLASYETWPSSPANTPIALKLQAGATVFLEWRGALGDPSDGALVHRQGSRSQWLDMIPEGSQANNFSNALLVPGLTFSSPDYGINVVCVSKTASALTLLVNLPSISPDAPKNLDAHQSSATAVALSWSAPSTPSPVAYEVSRTEDPAGTWTTLTTTVTGTTYTDSGGTVGHTYLYRVRAKFGSSWSLFYSDPDPATLFTDPTTGGSASPLAGALVKSVHLSELQTAVTMRHLLTAGSSTVTWQSVAAGGLILPSNVQQIRDETDAVLGNGAYTDTLVTGLRIKSQHIFELRERVK